MRPAESVEPAKYRAGTARTVRPPIPRQPAQNLHSATAGRGIQMGSSWRAEDGGRHHRLPSAGARRVAAPVHSANGRPGTHRGEERGVTQPPRQSSPPSHTEALKGTQTVHQEQCESLATSPACLYA